MTKTEPDQPPSPLHCSAVSHLALFQGSGSQPGAILFPGERLVMSGETSGFRNGRKRLGMLLNTYNTQDKELPVQKSRR